MVDAHVISDHHLYHDNIIKYCNRPFANVDEMHQFGIEEWNSVVTPDSIVIHLGDYICGGTKEQVEEITRQLNGYKILITGNHDRKGKQWFLDVGFNRVFKHRWCVGMYCFSHRPQDADYLTENKVRYNLHGHSHKHDYGDPYYNFGVDLIGWRPKKVKLNLTREDLMNGDGITSPDGLIDYKHGKRRAYGKSERFSNPPVND